MGNFWGKQEILFSTNISHRQAFQQSAPAKFPINYFSGEWGIFKENIEALNHD